MTWFFVRLSVDGWAGAQEGEKPFGTFIVIVMIIARTRMRGDSLIFPLNSSFSILVESSQPFVNETIESNSGQTVLPWRKYDTSHAYV